SVGISAEIQTGGSIVRAALSGVAVGRRLGRAACAARQARRRGQRSGVLGIGIALARWHGLGGGGVGAARLRIEVICCPYTLLSPFAMHGRIQHTVFRSKRLARAKSNGNGRVDRLEEAMSALVLAQANLVQAQAALAQQHTAFLVRMAEIDAR